METDKQRYDRAFSLLLDAIEEMNSNSIKIGEHEKEIERLRKKQEEELRAAFIIAANCFTREKIIEIHKKSVELLKCNDFNEDEYIQLFSDISRLEYRHIDFLIQRQNEINFHEFKLNDEHDPTQDKKSFISTLADILKKGGANDD